jgi:hypothetical protein
VAGSTTTPISAAKNSSGSAVIITPRLVILVARLVEVAHEDRRKLGRASAALVNCARDGTADCSKADQTN